MVIPFLDDYLYVQLRKTPDSFKVIRLYIVDFALQ